MDEVLHFPRTRKATKIYFIDTAKFKGKCDSGLRRSSGKTDFIVYCVEDRVR